MFIWARISHIQNRFRPLSSPGTVKEASFSKILGSHSRSGIFSSRKSFKTEHRKVHSNYVREHRRCGTSIFFQHVKWDKLRRISLYGIGNAPNLYQDPLPYGESETKWSNSLLFELFNWTNLIRSFSQKTNQFGEGSSFTMNVRVNIFSRVEGGLEIFKKRLLFSSGYFRSNVGGRRG